MNNKDLSKKLTLFLSLIIFALLFTFTSCNNTTKDTSQETTNLQNLKKPDSSNSPDKNTNPSPTISPFPYKTLKPWQVEGIKSAMEDSDPEVWMLAWWKIGYWTYYSDDPDIRDDGLKLQKSLKTTAIKHGKILTGHLKKKYRYSYENADIIEAIRNMGEPGYRYFNLIIPYIRNSRMACGYILDIMAESGELRKKHVKQILKIAESGSKFDSYKAVQVLSKMNLPPEETAPVIRKFLKNSPPISYSQNIYRFINMDKKHSGKLLPAMTLLLKDKDPHIQKLILVTLSNMREDAKKAAPEISKLLKSPDQKVRFFAAIALGSTKSGAVYYIPQLLEMLKEKNPMIIAGTLEGLGNMGELAKEHTSTIAGFMNHEDYRVRASAVEAVGKMGKSGLGYKKEAAKLLNDEDDSVRYYAIKSFGEMGKDAVKYIPDIDKSNRDYLKKLEKDRNSFVEMEREEHWSRKEVGSDPSKIYKNQNDVEKIVFNFECPIIFKSTYLINESNMITYINEITIKAFSNMGDSVEQYYPEVMEAACRFYESNFSSVLYLKPDEVDTYKTIGNLIQLKDNRNPEVIKLLNNDNYQVRGGILNSLKFSGKFALNYEQDIAKMLKDKKPEIKILAMKTLMEVSRDPRKYNKEIEKLVNDKDKDVRYHTLQVLFQTDKKNQKYLPMISNNLTVKNYGDIEINNNYYLLRNSSPPHKKNNFFLMETWIY